MSVELTMLVWAVALTFVQAVIGVQGALNQVGLPLLAGNRENVPAITGWGGRAKRAHANMVENLVLFAALVLAAHAMGKSNDMTVLGAQIFFWGRVAYAAVYVAGLAWVRTGVWGVSVVGLAMIFLQLI